MTRHSNTKPKSTQDTPGTAPGSEADSALSPGGAEPALNTRCPVCGRYRQCGRG